MPECKVLVETHESPIRGRVVYVALKDRRAELTMMEAEDLATRIMELVDADFAEARGATW